jgi:hypothetical protein
MYLWACLIDLLENMVCLILLYIYNLSLITQNCTKYVVSCMKHERNILKTQFNIEILKF